MPPDEQPIFAQSQLSQTATDNTLSVADEPHRFTCRQCGSAMHYHIGSQAITCTACGHSESIDTPAAKTVKEHPLADALRQVKLKPLSAPETTIECEHCGATSTWHAERLSDECPYCQTPMAKLDTANNRFHIEAIIPFGIDDTESLKRLTQWLGSRWFAPNALKSMGGHHKQFEGIYVPHWTFDSLTYTDYEGERGEHYTVYERKVRTVNGRREVIEVPVTKTRWYYASGRVRVLFDDVLVLASMFLPKMIVNQLRPWQLNLAEPYTPKYLAGLKADYYQLDLDEAFQVAKKMMASDINHAICSDIGGDVQRIHHQATQYQNSTYKLIMLPVWYSAFEYKGKNYHTVINAQTGKVAGTYPKSAAKITIAILLGLVVVGVTAYFYSQGAPR